MTKDEKAAIAVAVTCLLPAIYGAKTYITVVREERRKRKSIEKWKEENLQCINNSQNRLFEILESDNFTQAEFMKAVAEEQMFLSIVRNQPMY